MTAEETTGPPKFLNEEIVHIVGMKGNETYDLDDEPIDPSALIGQEGKVGDARPTRDGKGWLIQVWVEAREKDYPEEDRVEATWFSEDLLESTGLIVEWNDEDGEVKVPLDRSKAQGWQDEIELYLIPDLTEEEAAQERLLDGDFVTESILEEDITEERTGAVIARQAAAALADQIEVEGSVLMSFVEGLHDDEEDEGEDWDFPFGIVLTISPAGDAFAAFERIVSEPEQGWEQDVGETPYFLPHTITSRWRRSGEHVFLAPGVREAEVRLTYYTSPKAWSPSSSKQTRQLGPASEN